MNLRQVYQDFIFEKYESWILSEDDNLFSPNFLDYVNQNLEIYKMMIVYLLLMVILFL